jgi:hypothetical protein
VRYTSLVEGSGWNQGGEEVEKEEEEEEEQSMHQVVT